MQVEAGFRSNQALPDFTLELFLDTGVEVRIACRQRVGRKVFLPLDFQLPGASGKTIADQIKSDPDLKDTVLVLLTSVAFRGDAKKYSEAGFAAYLVKPVKQADLMEALAILWATSKSGKTMRLLTRHTLKEHGKVEIRQKFKRFQYAV